MPENIISNSETFSTNDLLKDSAQTFGFCFNGNITFRNANHLINTINNVIPKAKEEKLSYLFLSINSPGGFIEPAFLIKDFLDSLKEHFKIITHNAGIVASSANIVYMTGNYKTSLSRSYFYFHEFFTFGDNQNCKLSETLSKSFMLRKHASLFKNMMDSSLSEYYRSYTNRLLYSDTLLLAEQNSPLKENLSNNEQEEYGMESNILPFAAVDCSYTAEIVEKISWNPNMVCLLLPD